jgi:hypothetical protein
MSEPDAGYRPPPRRRRGGAALITGGVVAVLVAVAVAVTLVELASSGSVKTHLGRDTLAVGRAGDLANEIDAHGPLLLPDLANRDRPIFVQHLGPDPLKGWVAIQALIPGEAPRCVLGWDARTRVFRDPCTAATFPDDGTGLVRYPVTVLPSKRINVDLRTRLTP